MIYSPLLNPQNWQFMSPVHQVTLLQTTLVTSMAEEFTTYIVVDGQPEDVAVFNFWPKQLREFPETSIYA